MLALWLSMCGVQYTVLMNQTQTAYFMNDTVYLCLLLRPTAKSHGVTGVTAKPVHWLKVDGSA